jgi:hypothetical protein
VANIGPIVAHALVNRVARQAGPSTGVISILLVLLVLLLGGRPG